MRRKFPEFEREFKVAFPIASRQELKLLEKAGISTVYNEFCKDKDIVSHYGVYWKA